MTVEEIKWAECWTGGRAVVDNWTNDLLWYMQEYRDLGYEKIANIFILNFALKARQMALELEQLDEEERGE